jgi:hypothetical protein
LPVRIGYGVSRLGATAYWVTRSLVFVRPSTDLSRLYSSRVQPTRQHLVARTECQSVPILFQIVSGVVDHTWIQMLRIFLTSLARPAYR